MFDKSDNLYFIEMGPRNGGNMIPDLLLIATGEDMIAATVESAMGNEYKFNNAKNKNKCIATYVLHSSKDRYFQYIKFKNDIEDKIIKKVMYKKKGDPVQYFDGSNKAIGIIFLKFNNEEEMLKFMDNPAYWIEVILE